MMKKQSRYISDKNKKIILERQNYRCANTPDVNLFRIGDFPCILWESTRNGRFMESGCEFDHVIEFSLTHETDINSLQALCHSCHAYKTKDFQQELAQVKKKGIIGDYVAGHDERLEKKTKKVVVNKKKPVKVVDSDSSDMEHDDFSENSIDTENDNDDNFNDDIDVEEKVVEYAHIFKDFLKHRIKYNGYVIPVVFDIDNGAWFGGKEVTLALGYPDTNGAFQNAIRNNVFPINCLEFHKFYFDNSDFHQRKLFIKEPGLYRLMLRSRKPDAIKFSIWAIEHILPSLRKFDSYKLSEKYEQQYADILQKINFLKKEKQKSKADNIKIANANEVSFMLLITVIMTNPFFVSVIRAI